MWRMNSSTQLHDSINRRTRALPVEVHRLNGLASSRAFAAHPMDGYQADRLEACGLEVKHATLSLHERLLAVGRRVMLSQRVMSTRINPR
jgi:hypothetical protein